MELRASAKCSAAAKACLVAGRYAGVTLAEVADDAADDVVLRLGGDAGAADGGDVKGAEAVLRRVQRVVWQEVFVCSLLVNESGFGHMQSVR